MAEDNDSLMREVESEIRRERMEKIWQRYNGLIVGGVLAFLVAVGGYQFFHHRQVEAAYTAGADFLAAGNLSDQKKQDDADKAYAAIIADSPAGVASLAKLRLAGAEVKAGKTKEAIATFDSLATASGADNLLRSFAQLQASSLLMETADYSEIENRLKPLLGDDAPYDRSARELLGVAAYKAKKYDEARKHLEPLLTDPLAAQDIQDRVKILLADIASAEVGSTPAPAAQSEAKPATPEATAAEKPAEPTTKSDSSTTANGADKKP